MSLSGRLTSGYLFGNILAVTWDVTVIVGNDGGSLLLALFEFLVMSFDPIYGEAIGIPVKRMKLLLLFLVAFSVVMLIKIVGIILLIALLTIPGAISRQHMKGLPGIMAGAILLGAVFVTIGLFISYLLDVPSGATIIITAAAAFFLDAAISR
jgi:zinc transport system permease protein